MVLFEIGSSYLLGEDGKWKKLEEVSEILPVRLSNKLVLSWEPNLVVRRLDGVCCANCFQFFFMSQVKESLCDGYCKDCAMPALWLLKND